MDGLSMQEALEATRTPLRDQIAMVALGYLLGYPSGATEIDVCRRAYEWADAMLKVREEKR